MTMVPEIAVLSFVIVVQFLVIWTLYRRLKKARDSADMGSESGSNRKSRPSLGGDRSPDSDV